QRQTYSSYATFSDPDGNTWLLQEVTARLPGRVGANTTTFVSPADAYTPPPPNTAPPAMPNANNVNLVENIGRLKLAVERVLPLQGRVVPVGELYAAAGR